MNRKSLIAVTAIGLAAAIAIPTIAFGNARSNEGSLHFEQAAQTPLVARLLGTSESPLGDPDSVGLASVTFDIVSSLGSEVCWDLSYSGLAQPTLAHIHQGGAAVNGPIVVPFVPFDHLGPTSATGCTPIATPLAEQILDNPGNFYVNVHNTEYPGGAMRGQLANGDRPAGEAHLLPTPLRAHDSRDNGAARIGANETRLVDLGTGKDGLGASAVAVPAGATAAIVTLTVTDTIGGGYLKMYSAASAEPATSSINWFANNQTFAVSTQVAVNAASQVKITSGPGSTQFVIDVVGYLF